jgi:hypothetical protein
MPHAALLRYELVLFGRSFADAFSHKRDRLVLAIVTALALLWLRQSVDAPNALQLPRGLELVALAAAPISFQWNRLVSRRLAWLAEESALAPYAADRRARLGYRLAAQLVILLPMLTAAALAGLAAGRCAAVTGLAVAAHGAGLLASRLGTGPGRSRIAERRQARPAPEPLTGPRTAFLALLRVQALKLARPGRALAILLTADALLTFAGSSLAAGAAPGAKVAAAALPSLLLLVATARNDARLGGFLAFAGYSAGFVALAVCGLPAASFAAASLAVLASGTSAAAPAIATLALTHLVAATIATARAWLSPGKDNRKVDFQLQVEGAGLLLVGLMLPPLGLLALAARLWMLRLSWRDSIWRQF